MPQIIAFQELDGEDFDGSADKGLFVFPFDGADDNAAVVCDALALHIPSTSGISWAAIYFEPKAGNEGAPMLVMQANATQMLGPNTNWDLKACPGRVPRSNDGSFFELKLYTSGLSGLGQATLSYRFEQ